MGFTSISNNRNTGPTLQDVQNLINQAIINNGTGIPEVAIDPPFAQDRDIWINTTTNEMKIRFNGQNHVFDFNGGTNTSIFGTPVGDF